MAGDYEERETCLVILGAGASYDCLPVASNPGTVKASGLPGLPHLALADVTPPLTKDLASPGALRNLVLNAWPWAGPAIAFLQQKQRLAGTAPTQTLEQALREYEEQGQDDLDTQRSLLSMRFYLRQLLWSCTRYMLSDDLTAGITNHLHLLNDLKTWLRHGNRCVVFVSFNYDLLIEEAMRAMWDFNSDSINSYLSHDTIHLLKPHGSVQWSHPCGTTPIGSETYLDHCRRSVEIALTDGVHTDRIEAAGMLANDAHPSGTSRARIPALALPVDGKAEFVWPAEQAARLGQLQSAVSRVLTIGWRAMEPHFLECLGPIVRSDARCLVVSGGEQGDAEAGLAMERLRHSVALEPSGWKSYAFGFRSLMSGADELAWLLNSSAR